MSRRVGFGEGEEDPSGKSRSGPKAVGLRVMAAIVVTLGVIVWIVAGLGGPDDFLDSFVRVAEGEAALVDLLSVIVPALLVEAAALIFLLRGIRVSKPRIPELDPYDEPAGEPVDHSAPRPAPQPTRREKLEQKINDKMPKGPARVFAGVFLFVWLIGWSTGITFAFGALISEWGTGASLFLMVWLTLAVIGWFFAVGFLIKIIKGR